MYAGVPIAMPSPVSAAVDPPAAALTARAVSANVLATVGYLWGLAVLAVVASWFAILVTGRYPRRLFDYVVGVLRWNNRVIGYACTLVTDQYPPFRLS